MINLPFNVMTSMSFAKKIIGVMTTITTIDVNNFRWNQILISSHIDRFTGGSALEFAMLIYIMRREHAPVAHGASGLQLINQIKF